MVPKNVLPSGVEWSWFQCSISQIELTVKGKIYNIHNIY
jgi:hypothetical protein